MTPGYRTRACAVLMVAIALGWAVVGQIAMVWAS